MDEPKRKRLRLTRSQIIAAIVAVAVLLAGSYWFGVRPYMVRKDCRQIALKASKGAYESYEVPYQEYHPEPWMYGTPHYETEYKTQYIDKTAETYTAAYALCTSKKGV